MSLKDKVHRIRAKQIFSETEELMITGRYEEAKAKIDILEKQHLASKDQARCDAWLSLCMSKHGDFLTAINIAERVVEENSDIPKHEEAVLDAMLTLGIALCFLGRLDESLEMCDRTEDIIDALDLNLSKNRARKGTFLYNKGTTLVSKGEIDIAIEYLSMSYPILEEVGNLVDAGASLNNIGEGYRVIGNLELALQNYTEAQVHAESTNYERNIAIGLGNIGIVHYQKGDLNKAADLLEQSISRLTEGRTN